MISAELRFEGFDARSWTNLISLFFPDIVTRIESEAADSDAPEVDREHAPETPHGTLIVVEAHDGRVLKALHTAHGRVRDLEYGGPDRMPALCRQYGARRCVVVRDGAIEELGERLAMRLQRGDDYLTQWLVLLRAMRELVEAELIRFWPRPLANVPVPTPGTVHRALDLVMPDDHCLVAVVWDRGEQWTAFALRRSGGVVDRVAGPDLIATWTGPLGGDWRRDYRVVADAVARNVAPVHLGLFTELHTIRALLRNPDPGAWAQAVAVRDVVLHPAPPYVTVALGADALRAAASASARMLGGVDLLRAFSPFGEYLRSRVAEVASVSSTLGFNPLRTLATWLRRSEEDDEGEASATGAAGIPDREKDDDSDPSDP